MMFLRRTEAPKKDNPYYYSNNNIFYRDGYGMPNCTCYAHGRYAEITGIWLPAYGNAEDWIATIREKTKCAISMSPALGAVACWKVGKVKDNKDGAGHVAIVEAIKPNGDIITSNSASKGTEWYEQTYKAEKNYAWTSSKTGKKYDFQGFILPPSVYTDVPQVLTVTGSLNLRANVGTSSKILCVMHKGDEFRYDGLYMMYNGTKWVHGVFDKYIGWASSKYMK